MNNGTTQVTFSLFFLSNKWFACFAFQQRDTPKSVAWELDPVFHFFFFFFFVLTKFYCISFRNLALKKNLLLDVMRQWYCAIMSQHHPSVVNNIHWENSHCAGMRFRFDYQTRPTNSRSVLLPISSRNTESKFNRGTTEKLQHREQLRRKNNTLVN